MISLEVKPHCHECLEFTPDTENASIQYLGDMRIVSDTTIRCKHRRRCEAIRKYLEDQMKSENK